MSCAKLPEDGVPWFDFDDQGVHYRNRDTSAAALISGGLLILSREVSEPKKAQQYRQESERIAHSIIDRYLTPVAKDDSTPPGVLRHGTGTRLPKGCLIYGQYYLLETLLELEKAGKTDTGHRERAMMLLVHTAGQESAVHREECVPVTKLALSEARNTAAPTSSSSFPKRFIGVRKRNSCPRAVPSSSAALRSVRKTPGAMAFTQTPWRAHSIARDLVSDATAALLAE